MQLPIVEYREYRMTNVSPRRPGGARARSLLRGFAPVAAAGIIASLPWGAVDAAESVIFNDSAAHLCYLEALRGSTLVETEDCDAAIEHQSLKREDFAATLSNRGLLLARSGELDSALKDHDRAIESAPEIPSLYVNRANTYSRAQRLAEARADLDRAILMIESADSVARPQQPSEAQAATDQPASGAATDGLEASAQSAAEAAVPVPDLAPVLAAAYYNRALIEQRERNLERALADAVRARDLAPDIGNCAAYVADLEQIRAARAAQPAALSSGQAPGAAGQAPVPATTPATTPATAPATAPSTETP